MAAWCPCATAVMMFLGPKAASPPKKAFGCVDWKVWPFNTGRPHLSNSRPMSGSIHGESVFLTDGDEHFVAFHEHVRTAGGDEFPPALRRRIRP